MDSIPSKKSSWSHAKRQMAISGSRFKKQKTTKLPKSMLQCFRKELPVCQHVIRLQFVKDLLPCHRGVTRLDGAQGKKQVWRLHVRTSGLSEANLLYWRKYLWHLWKFPASPAVIRRPGNCTPLAPLVTRPYGLSTINCTVRHTSSRPALLPFSEINSSARKNAKYK